MFNYFFCLGSINRASCIDELRQSQSGHYTTGKSPRSIADGQSQHSFSNNSSRYFGNATLTSNLINTRPGLFFLASVKKKIKLNNKKIFFFRTTTIASIIGSSF